MAVPVLSDDVPTMTCLSTEPHDERITDLVSHYFGCIEIWERKHFFNPDNGIWKSILKRIENELAQDETFHGDPFEGAKNRINKEMGKAAIDIEAHYTQTEIIVKEISEERSTDAIKGRKPNLVAIVEESHNAWRNSIHYKAGIKAIRDWREKNIKKPEESTGDEEHISGADIPLERRRVRRRKKAYPDEPGIDPTAVVLSREEISSPIEIPQYCVDRDVKAHVIQYRPASNTSGASGRGVFISADAGASSRAVPNLEPVEEDPPRFKGSFPDHRIAISSLLQGGQDPRSNILSRPEARESEESGIVRHIHFPSNNMQVSLSGTSRLLSGQGI